MTRTCTKVAVHILVCHVPLAAGVLAAMLGMAELALWHLQASQALDWAANIEVIPHHASSALFLCGLALGASTFGATRVTAGLALLAVALALSNLSALTLGHADVFATSFTERYGAITPRLPWVMPVSNAVAFLLAGGALLLVGSWCRQGNAMYRHLITLFGTLSILPLIPGLAFTSRQEFALDAGHLVLVFGLVCFAHRRQVREISSPLGWIATSVIAAQLALTLMLWNGLGLIIGDKQDRHLATETTGLGQRFMGALQHRVNALERMAERWELAGGTPRRLWAADAAGYVADLRGFQALQWADAAGRVRWVVPEQGNEAAIDFDNSRDPVRLKMLDRARNSEIPIVTGPVDLIQGGQGLLITRALRVGDRSDGFIVAVFRVDELLATLTQEIVSLDFAVDVSLGGQSVFRRSDAATSQRARMQAQEFVVDGEAGWKFRIWPNDTAMQRSPFSDLFLASGLAMTLLVAIAFWFWGRNAHAARKLKEANLALCAERNFINGLIDNTNALTIVLDPAGHIVRFNRACEELTGYAAVEVLGKCFWSFAIPPEEAPNTADSFARLVAREQHGRFEGDVIAKDGSVYRIAWSNSVLTGPDGHARHVMAVGIDITERQRAADALVAAKDEADRANRAKSEFLSSMSHELRTPMNAVLGFAQLISMDPTIAPTHRESVEQILRAGDLLLHLINDILNLSRIESGRIEPNFQPVACSDLVAECIDMVAPLAVPREVRIEATGDTRLFAQADRQFLKQILLNLLSNAIKYNRHSGQVDVHGTQDSNGDPCIAISDTGQGITPELQAQLFEPFNRLGAQNGAVEGSGIGLVVCKRLIEAMGGRIEVASAPGEGSVVTITLRGVPTAMTAGEETPASEAQPQTVLWIACDDSNRRLVRKILSPLPNIRLVDADNTDASIQVIRTHRPDLVIMDTTLPGTDHHGLLLALRRETCNARLPVIALGAKNSEREIVAARAAGFTEYLGQPVDVVRLRALATRLLARREAPPSRTAADAGEPDPIMTR